MNKNTAMPSQFPILSVLVVDDKVDVKVGAKTMGEQLRSLQESHPGLNVLTASTKREGAKLLYENHFNAVLTDHHLSKNSWGSELLVMTRVCRPAALRVIMTERPQYGLDGAPRFFGCFELPDQDAPQAVGPLADMYLPLDRTSVTEFIQYLMMSIGMPGLELVYRTNGSSDPTPIETAFENDIGPRLRHPKASPVRPLLAELEHALRSAFSVPAMGGMAERYDSRSLSLEDRVRELSLVPLTGGRSSSTVLGCTPRTAAGHSCGLCVVKISPRDETLEEVTRYHLYARLHRAAARRIELLGSCVVDTLGVACYSFAGGGIQAVRTLDALLNANDARAIHYLRSEFAPSEREWYSHVKSAGTDASMTKFFEECYDFKAADHIAPVFELTRAINDALNPISASQVLAKLRSIEYSSCIVHGDLNAGNILCGMSTVESSPLEIDQLISSSTPDPGSESNHDVIQVPYRTILIDYRHTRRGPVFIDFASLQASIRILSSELDGTFPTMEALLEREQLVWDAGWLSEANEHYAPELVAKLSFNELVEVELIRLARKNFEQSYRTDGRELASNIAQAEYCASCILYALRLLKITRLGQDIVEDGSGGFVDCSDAARLRLSIWVRQLADRLARLEE